MTKQILARFSTEEMRGLYADMGLDYGDLSGETRPRKVQELVRYAERSDRLPDLLTLLSDHRPIENWRDLAQPTAAARALQTPHANRQSPLSSSASPAALPAAPLHGFHGRSREMLALERAFADTPIVVLHGFGGLGKTTLAAEAGRWFTRTGRFPGGAAFVSFEQGGSLEQLTSWVGQTLSGDRDWVIHYDATAGESTPAERIAALLAQRPALLILDNFESVLGRDPLMPAAELADLLNAVHQWATDPRSPTPDPRSRILITTRDTAFNDARFAPSRSCRHIPLSGLAMGDALGLAAAVLDDHGIDRAAIPRRELVELMTHLGGHPLSLNLVLPHLRRYSPSELITNFETLLPGFTQGEATERNESLAVSLEFSLRRLGDETRAALPDLAVFQGGCMEYDLLRITKIDAELWKLARVELEQAALVSVEPVPGISASFLRFHPTLLPYLSTQLSEERRAELEQTYWREYYGTAKELYRMDTHHPHEARAIAVREMPNLRRGLQLALTADALDQAVQFASRIDRFLDVFGRWRERDEMMERVREVTSRRVASSASAGGVTQAEFLMMYQQGEALRQQGQMQQAESIFQELLTRLKSGAIYDTAYDIAITQRHIGLCLQAQGRPSQAIPFCQQALTSFATLSDTSTNAKQMKGTIHTDLAGLYMELGKFDEAEEQYKAALVIDEELDDRRGMGVDLGQLGMLAMQRNDLPEAQRRYRNALETFRALGEAQMEAVAWHQLGRVAEEARQWAEAEHCYRESLQIKEAKGDLPGVARTCNQLAIVAKGDGRLPDAERWYLRAIEVNEQLGQQREMAVMLSNLANLYLSQKRLAEAERYARRAAAIKETLDLSAEPWSTYYILAQIAVAQGRPQEAADWRRKEQESRDAFAGTQHQVAPILKQFQGVIGGIIAACEGDANARAQIEGMFETFQKGNWQIADAIQQIWNDERDAETLTAAIDYNSRAIILAILAQLAGETPAAAQSNPVSASPPQPQQQQEEGLTLEGLLELVGQAIQPGAPAGLSEQLHTATRQLAQDPAAPPEIRALGHALNAILSGDRAPDLSALPPQLAGLVGQLLA